MQYHKHVTESGLTIIRIPVAGVKSATVLALVKVGSRYEDEKVSGISHFLEHMVFKGTEKYPTAQDVAMAVDAVGAEFNAFTSKEYTGYYVKAASKDMSLAIDVVSDMLLTPKLLTEDLEREKGVIIEEMNMYQDLPNRHISDVFEQMMYGGTSLGRDIIGTKESVRAINQKDFQEHLHKWYGLKNMIVVVAGDDEVIGTTKVNAEIEKGFSKGDVASRLAPKALTYPKKAISDKQKILVEYKKTEQAHFILGFPGIKRLDEDRYAVSVLSTLLGGNMSSRLFTEVREKRGLCYYVRSDMDSYVDTGFFGAAAGVDPQRVDEAIEVTLDQFMQLKNKKTPVTADELKRAKDYAIGSLILSMEDSQTVGLSYGMKYLLDGEIKTLDQVIASISAVSMEDVEKVIDRLIQPEQVRFAMIGPFEDANRFARILTD